MDGIELILAEPDFCFEVSQNEDQSTVSAATGHEARSEQSNFKSVNKTRCWVALHNIVNRTCDAEAKL